MEQKYIKFIAQSKKDYFDLLKSVISIPSPSYKEREIAVKIKDFLEQEAEKNHNCRANIYTDDIWNVYCEIGGPFHTDTECVLFCAHTDTLFPYTTLFRSKGLSPSKRKMAAFMVWERRITAQMYVL